MSEITRYPRYRVIAGLEQDLHGMMTRPDGFMYEEAEVAIVRAAAEITGLTAGVGDGVAGDLLGAGAGAGPPGRVPREKHGKNTGIYLIQTVNIPAWMGAK